MPGLFDDVLNNVGKSFSNKGFTYGTHEVIIGEARAIERNTKDNPNAKVIEITVFDEKDNDMTATCTLYFHTEGSAKMAVTKVLGILVHNVGEEKKDKVRELGKKLFGNITDLDESRDIALKLIQDKLIGKKAYLVAQPSGDYKTTSYGDIWHYPVEPQGNPRNETELVAKEVGGSVVDADDLPDELGDL